MSNKSKKSNISDSHILKARVVRADGSPLAVGEIESLPELQEYLAKILQERQNTSESCS